MLEASDKWADTTKITDLEAFCLPQIAEFYQQHGSVYPISAVVPCT